MRSVRASTMQAFSVDGTTLAAGCLSGKVYFVDPTAGEIKSSLRGHTDRVWSVCFSPCGEKIASGGGNEYGNKDYSIRIWDAKTGEQIGSPLSGHSNWVFSVAWSPDGTKLASGSKDKTVRIWEAATGKQLSQLNVGYVLLSLSKY